ncbi:MAG: hypothetical protein NZM18_07035 [Thermoflexales bacterium]|nr:hypothetical protein [Thermoflexales bacterium]MDW8351582.1 hypothetical protein [Anaerolineae bacterium]
MIEEILLLHHTHTDIGYTHEQPIVWELNRQFIEDALDQIERTADWDAPSQPIWTCEVTETLRYWLRKATIAQVERFRRAVSAGRMSACAMPYNLTPMVGTPQFIRALSALPELRQMLGLPLNVALNHDVNGLPWTMIPLMLDAGIEMVIMGINVHFGAFPLSRPLFFRWIGPDGRSIIALNGEHYGMFQRYARLSENSLDAMADGIAAYLRKLEAQRYPHTFAYLTLTHHSFWDNNPPYPAAFDLIRRWNAERRTPRIRFVAPDELLSRAKAMPLPEYAGDWTDYWNFGAGSSAHETRLAHQARAHLYAADLFSLQRAASRDGALPATTDEAYDALTLWDEHTWGAYSSVSDPDRDTTIGGWYHKAKAAYQARSLAHYVLSEQLEALAANPRHAPRIDGFIFVNPTPFPRRDYLPMTRAMLRGEHHHFSSTAHHLMEHRELLEQGKLDDVTWIGPISVPAYGYARLPLSALKSHDTPITQETEALDGAIVSGAHRLEFDPRTGAVTALIDRRTGANFVDPSSPWPMLGLVHETADADPASPYLGRDVMLQLDYSQFQEHSFCDWPARRTVEQVESARVIVQPHRAGLEVKSALPGARATRRIWLHGHRSEIAIEIVLHKDEVRTPDAIYLALPLNLPNWQAVFDTMGTPTRLDAEQLPGCCRDWVTVSGYVDVHTDRLGLTLACPDAPLVMVGDFNFGKRQLALDHSRPPLLLAWLLNNYWTTNFRVAQPGVLRFRYEIATHAGFDPVDAARVAAFARHPLMAHPSVQVRAPESGQVLQIDGAGVFAAACRRLDDGALVWLQNVTAEAHIVKLRLPQRRVYKAESCDTFGRPTGPLPVEDGSATVIVPGRGIVGVRLHDQS